MDKHNIMDILLDKEKWDFYLDWDQKFENVDGVGVLCKNWMAIAIEVWKTVAYGHPYVKILSKFTLLFG